MKTKTHKTHISKILLSICLLISLLVYGFFANQARKEIYFLCGNFGKADTLQNVVRQLDTSTFSSYTLHKQTNTTYLKHSSILLLKVKSCNVSFDQQGKLLTVAYD